MISHDSDNGRLLANDLRRLEHRISAPRRETDDESARCRGEGRNVSPPMDASPTGTGTDIGGITHARYTVSTVTPSRTELNNSAQVLSDTLTRTWAALTAAASGQRISSTNDLPRALQGIRASSALSHLFAHASLTCHSLTPSLVDDTDPAHDNTINSDTVSALFHSLDSTNRSGAGVVRVTPHATHSAHYPPSPAISSERVSIDLPPTQADMASASQSDLGSAFASPPRPNSTGTQHLGMSTLLSPPAQGSHHDLVGRPSFGQSDGDRHHLPSLYPGSTARSSLSAMLQASEQGTPVVPALTEQIDTSTDTPLIGAIEERINAHVYSALGSRDRATHPFSAFAAGSYAHTADDALQQAEPKLSGSIHQRLFEYPSDFILNAASNGASPPTGCGAPGLSSMVDSPPADAAPISALDHSYASLTMLIKKVAEGRRSYLPIACHTAGPER
jgi:hypothetical protein